jgi:S-DNA-T family DNA segregation ATPase FtsK/SpoIIIE
MDVIRFCSNPFGTPPATNPMDPVTLSISQVREEIVRAMGGRDSSGPGEPSTALLGRMFHEVFAELQWQAVLTPETLAKRQGWTEHIYEKLLGPRLTEHLAVLQDAGLPVLNLWQSTRHLGEWLAGLIEAASRDGVIHFDRTTQQWANAEQFCVTEQSLQWTVSEPNWARPVRITGIADALWRNPRTGNWCVVEYKLGRTVPAADAAQACLYHQMLQASGLVEVRAPGAIALISFLPQLEERIFEGPKLAAAQRELRALIGRLAGVLPGQRPLPTAAPSSVPRELGSKYEDLGHKLVHALAQYGAVVELRGSPVVGPAFLRYTIMPGRGVKVSSVASKARDIQVQLDLETAPIIQNVRSKLVIDVERPDRQTVLFSAVKDRLPAPEDVSARSKLMLGIDLYGQVQFADLSQTPHILVAGTTGSGKTEWLRSAIAALLASNTPETLRLVLIDPKRNAFGDLKGSPFLLDQDALVYPPEHSVVELLDRLIVEMEDRYRLFEMHQASDLLEYTTRWDPRKPRIVCFCDEYADLVAVRGERKQVEERIRRLGAKARAAGIHLIIATQYPRADIVDGALKANLPGRVCLRVTSHTQSNVMLNMSGAERLLGKGDLFWMDIGEPVRLQAPLLKGPIGRAAETTAVDSSVSWYGQ